ncbi:MAG: hypothetical protein O9306_03810 [Beijerinckiaceae bacterium]|jgi:hypothetical protein|nr:hypothetical protein [Beijerinckiaceae bacterium]
MRRIGLALMVATPSMASAHATDTVLPHAAGSLRGALTESSQAFQQAHSTAVTQRYARLLDDFLRAGLEQVGDMLRVKPRLVQSEASCVLQASSITHSPSGRAFSTTRTRAEESA